MSDEHSNVSQTQQCKVNPFSLSDKGISASITASHNPKAKIHEVDHLYNKVSNIVEEISLKHIIDKRLELKYGESKVSHGSNFVPTFHTLKNISSQMTNKCFDANTAHETIIWILEKLHDYSWATKGVTSLAAFALDYGKPWCIFKMAPTKTNSLEIHISSDEGLERPIEAIASDDNTLIGLAMQLIKIVIDLEKLIVKNDELQGTAKDELDQVPRDIYTYWAIFILIACVSRMTLGLKFELSQKIDTILSGFASRWKPKIAEIEDYFWRLNVFRSPQGVLQLLTAMIFPRDIPYPKIYDNTTKSLVSHDELKAKHLLLFISESRYPGSVVINNLHPIHESFMIDPKKSNYRILWIPVEKEWDLEKKEEFHNWKSKMPWYIVEFFEPTKGYRPLNELWYHGETMVVVVDPQGNVLHPDAYDLIERWDAATAFPFTTDREKQLSEQYGWLWELLRDAHIPIGKWMYHQSHIFIYGGTDEAPVEKLGELFERIQRESISLPQGVRIEYYNLRKELEILEMFWSILSEKFQKRILNKKDDDDDILLQMEMLLAMKNEKAWVLFMKGYKLLVVDYDTQIYDTLEEFENWKANVLRHSFDKAFIDYYHMKRSQEPERLCYYFQIENLSFAPQNVICPDPDCKLKTKIKSIEYMCSHEKLNQHLKSTSKKKDDEGTLQS